MPLSNLDLSGEASRISDSSRIKYISPGLRLLSGTLFPPLAPPGTLCGDVPATEGDVVAGARSGDRDKKELVPLDAAIAGDDGALTMGRDGITNAATH